MVATIRVRQGRSQFQDRLLAISVHLEPIVQRLEQRLASLACCQLPLPWGPRSALDVSKYMFISFFIFYSSGYA